MGVSGGTCSHETLGYSGVGTGGTCKISGTNHRHILLERELADLETTVRSNVVFHSGLPLICLGISDAYLR
jgi:7-keto-8-aminopelargonate synthetase-like enzyme